MADQDGAVCTVGDKSEPELKKLFNEAWNLFKEIEKSDSPSSSDLVQKKVKKCIKLFSDVTHMVNILELFSRNEELGEITSSNLRYILLPAFLGELTLLQMDDDRFSSVSRAKVYFKDFFERCKDYGIAQEDVSKFDSEAEDSKGRTYHRSMADRQAKIDRYKEAKELKIILETLEKRLEDSPNGVDDEVQREYYLSWIRLWLNETIEKFSLIQSELEILEHMINIKSGKVKQPEEKPKNREPIKPILITKDSIKKSKVFGAGYPSLPSITPEEWMDEQIASGKVVLDYNPNVNTEPDKESSDEEDDSEEKLKKARDWDEWKDDHRRGEGNRINRG